MSCQMEKKMNFIKIGREGGRIIEYAVNAGVTLQDMLNMASIMLTVDESIYVNDIKQNGDFLRESVLDRSRIIIKKEASIIVRVARIGEPLVNIGVSYGSTLNDVLRMARREPNANEDVWIHSNDNSKGRLATNLDGLAVENLIYIVEPKKTLRNKIYGIITKYCENMSGECEDATNEIVSVLKRDYNVS
jgi:hypothetical protein